VVVFAGTVTPIENEPVDPLPVASTGPAHALSVYRLTVVEPTEVVPVIVGDWFWLGLAGVLARFVGVEGAATGVVNVVSGEESVVPSELVAKAIYEYCVPGRSDERFAVYEPVVPATTTFVLPVETPVPCL
jgi:hypothetical protein